MKDDLKDSIERAGKTLYLKRRWDDQLAEYVYELREVSRMNQFSDVLIADGDREWAGRQSDHYKLKIRGES